MYSIFLHFLFFTAWFDTMIGLQGTEKMGIRKSLFVVWGMVNRPYNEGVCDVQASYSYLCKYMSLPFLHLFLVRYKFPIENKIIVFSSLVYSFPFTNFHFFALHNSASMLEFFIKMDEGAALSWNSVLGECLRQDFDMLMSLLNIWRLIHIRAIGTCVCGKGLQLIFSLVGGISSLAKLARHFFLYLQLL